MKLKFLFSLIAAGSLTAAAQGYQDGVDNFNAGRFDVAKAILVNNLNNAETDKAVSYYYLGAIDFKEGNIQGAKENFDKGVAANPAYGYNLIGLGEVALKNGDKSAAENYFKDALKTDKKNSALTAGVARAYYNVDPTLYANDIEKYIAKAFKDSKNKEAAVYMLQGDMVASEDPGRAAGLYEMAIKYDADRKMVNREAYVKYASTYFHVNPKFAIAKLEELNELEPNSALAQRELAEKYYDNNQFGRACIQYGKYMENPNHFQSDEQRYAGLLYSAGEYDKSLELANQVLAKDPQNFYMYRVIMLDKAAKEDWAGAQEAGEKLFGHPDASYVANDYVVYGDALIEQNKGQEAVAIFEKAIELNPDKPELLTKLSSVYEKAGQPEKAVEVMKKYLEQGNGNATDLYNMARRYHALTRSLELGTPERAAAADEGIKYIDMAIEKANANGALYRTKGELQLMKNDNKPNADMAATYEKMLEIYDADPANKEKYASTYAAADYLLGIYYSDIDKEKAKKYLSDYLQFKPEDETVKALLETL